tara:strand:+ start:368 stop:934 length:567 start_codon:yes stop_codon:yes gene_type:complete
MNSIKFLLKNIKKLIFLGIISLLLSACNGKLPGGDARKYPPDPKKRVAQNMAEGRAISLNDIFSENNKGGGVFEFASSNELWRASLDVIDFIPLSSVNYSGGVIISDWYSPKKNSKESIKISIRFLTNEIRSDALDIKVFNRKCNASIIDCNITEDDGILVSELKREILKKAKLYEIENKNKKKNKKK